MAVSPPTESSAPDADVTPTARLRGLGRVMVRGLFGELLADGSKSMFDQVLTWLGSWL